jgi:hypothetical protein
MAVPRVEKPRSSKARDRSFNSYDLEIHIHTPSNWSYSLAPKIIIESYPFSTANIAVTVSFQFIICSYEESSPDRNVAA